MFVQCPGLSLQLFTDSPVFKAFVFFNLISKNKDCIILNSVIALYRIVTIACKTYLEITKATAVAESVSL